MTFLRSLAYHVGFYVYLVFGLIVLLPFLLMPRHILWQGIRTWSRGVRVLARLCGIKVEIRGLEHLPEGGCIVAMKHQSAFETVALLDLFHKPTFILKRELVWIPLFGWYIGRMGMIPIDRKRGSEVMKAMTREAGVQMRAGRQVVIFPEGTRRPVGAEPLYKFGVAHLYRETGMPVVPVALNSGLFIPRRAWTCHRGTLVVEFLPVIAPGIEQRAFQAQLASTIEDASDRLLLEAARDPAGPTLSEAARRRVMELTKS